ncbi:MAG TPA: hypothetical protein VLS89_15305, partial [Candidatus Nanopelagicales bacterium]|nr:hypothetical protein [Candidatus Nanopelagicales bacterium]
LDHDTHMVAVQLLPVALVFSGKLDEAEAHFEAALRLSAEAGDWQRKCLIYINRALLWVARKELHRVVEDMSFAIPLARQIGSPFLERQATLNGAEILHWEGKHRDARSLAERAQVLEERFMERTAVAASLLMARILIAEDAYPEAARLVDGIAASHRPEELAPAKRAFLVMLQRVLSELHVPLERGPSRRWEEILAEARGRLLDMELLELLYWWAYMTIHGGRWPEARVALEQARSLLPGTPMWVPRFEILERLT